MFVFVPLYASLYETLALSCVLRHFVLKLGTCIFIFLDKYNCIAEDVFIFYCSSIAQEKNESPWCQCVFF